MLSWLRQTCRPVFSLISGPINQGLILSSGAIQLYLRIYYPLIHLEELASSQLNDGTNLYGSALALLTVVLATYRSLELFFPRIRTWSVQQEQDSRFKETEQYESEATAVDFEALDAIDLAYGLTNAEVSTRLSKYGKNVLWTGRSWQLTVGRTMLAVGNVIPEVAMLAAAFCGEWMIAFALIPPIVISNGVDLYQMKQADDVNQSMSWSAGLRAVVLREGEVLEIDAADLVPGDVVHISKGQTVPADARVIRISNPLSCDQSAITGDPLGISKERGDMCYVSTGVVSGSAFCIVVDTGLRTFVGRTARLVSGSKSGGTDDRNLNDHVANIGSLLWTATIAAVLILFSTGTSPTEILRIALSCTMLTYHANGRGTAISMRAKTAAEMSKQGAVLQSIQDLETLAAVDVLLTDTTGTITENILMVLEPFCLDCDVEDLILIACLCQLWQQSDPITKAVLDSLRHYAQARDRLVRYKVIDYEPFDPTTKRMWALVESPDGEQVTCTLGAPKSCYNMWQEEHPDDPDNRHIGDRFKTAAASLATRGARTLGVLRKRENSKLELLGLLPLADGARWDASSAVREAHSLGVRGKLLTGNAAIIGESIAQSIGLFGAAIPMRSSQDKSEKDQANDLSIQEAEEADCFCEVFPEHKIEIVKTLQKSGHTVAVTGDGLNDVPALHYANFGIAVEGSSEKAQSAAQLVMLRPGIASLVAAITAARRHFRLLETFLIHRASGCIDLMAMCYLWYWKFGTPLDPEYLFLIICFDDLIQYSFSRHKHNGGTALEMLPARLSIHNVFRNGVWMNTSSIALKVLVLQYISSDNPGFARWILYLITILWNNLTFFLLYGRESFLSPGFLRGNLLKVLRSTSAAIIPLVFSWVVNERPMYFMTASGQSLAAASLASTLCQCWLMREMFNSE